MDIVLKNKVWWNYIENDLRELLVQSLLLIDTVVLWEKKHSAGSKFHDYSFVVFPAAKAYEGFLKKLFLDLGFISQDDYFGKRFRVGKALNPALDRERYKDVSVYDKLAQYCEGDSLAKILWDTWKRCRNVLFHWFPNEKNVISFDEAKERVELVIATIDAAYKECNISSI